MGVVVRDYFRINFRYYCLIYYCLSELITLNFDFVSIFNKIVMHPKLEACIYVIIMILLIATGINMVDVVKSLM